MSDTQALEPTSEIVEGVASGEPPKKPPEDMTYSDWCSLWGSLGGKPTSYRDWMPARALELLSADRYYPMGAIAASLGVHRSTFDGWCQDGEHKALSNAVKFGIAIQEVNLANKLFDKDLATSGITFLLKNSIHRYTDKVEVQNTHRIEDILKEQSKAAPKVDWTRKPQDVIDVSPSELATQGKPQGKPSKPASTDLPSKASP